MISTQRRPARYDRVTGHSLMNTDFRKLWIGQTISEVGSRISREGLPLTAVLILGASPAQMGLLSGIGAAATLLFSLPAGVWVDRLRRRPVLIATDLGRAALLATIPLAAALGVLHIGQLFVVAALGGVMTVLFDVAYQSYLPFLVQRDNIYEGNRRLRLSSAIAETVGPGLTGILVQWLTAPRAILLDALSFLCSAFFVGSIRKVEPERSVEHEALGRRESVEGIRIVARDPILRLMAAWAAMTGLSGGFLMGLYVLFAIRELQITPAVLGFVIACGGIGELCGAAVAPKVVGRIGVGSALLWGAVMSATGATLIPLAQGPALLVASQLIGDSARAVWAISFVSIRQSVTPDHLLGRVNSSMHLVERGFLPVGAMMGGWLASVMSIRTSMSFGAAGLLLACLWLIPVRRFSRIS